MKNLILALTAVVLLAACDRNTESFVEGEQPRSPDLARIFPETDASATRPAGTAPPVPASPARGDRGAPPVFSAQASPGGGGDGETIRGTIIVAPELSSSVPADGMLFVIARAAGVSAGPPMAVLRVPSPRFPLEFEIGPQNVMIPSMSFQGDIGITARLDSDGNAMTKLPGDLSGATDSAQRPGDTGVEIVLDEKL